MTETHTSQYARLRLALARDQRLHDRRQQGLDKARERALERAAAQVRRRERDGKAFFLTHETGDDES